MDKEQVSILTLTCNNLKYTKMYLESLFAHTSQIRTPYEVLIYDNGSTDGTVEYLQGLEQSGMIKVIYSPVNKGFPVGNNRLAEIAKGEYLCLCNNDIIFSNEWLEKLLRCIRSDPKLGAVGPYTSHSSGHQQVKNAPPYTIDEEFQKLVQKFNGTEKRVDFLVFFCCLIRKSVWDKIGGLDERMGRGCYEDNIFCWKLEELGYRMRIANAYCHHFSGKSFGYNEDAKKRVEYASLLAHNQKLFLKIINRYKTISLVMICADTERPETLKRSLDSVVEWIDQICIVFNYKGFPKPWRVKKLLKILKGFEINWKYVKFIDFSNVKNQSLKMAESDYIYVQDVDDILATPQGLRDIILRHPEIDVFKCIVLSPKEKGAGVERIIHNRFFKNKPEYRFRNRCHEDCTYSQLETNAKMLSTNITIHHMGNTSLEDVLLKNKRNYKLLMQDLKDKPHSLTYYGLVNCLILMNKSKETHQAIKLVDECFEKTKLTDKDPLTPKMWVLKGLACMNVYHSKEDDKKRAFALAGAKQSLHKAWDVAQHPEAGVNLAQVYILEKNDDKAMEILEAMYKIESFNLMNIPFDLEEVETLMLQKLGDCSARKKDWKNAEKYYRECLTVKMKLEVIDRFCQILRKSNRANEAYFLTIRAVNMFPTYFTGFFNMAQYELANKRYHTAKIYLQETLRIKPDYREAIHNLRMLSKILKEK